MSENNSFFSGQNVQCLEIYVGSELPSWSVAVLLLNTAVSDVRAWALCDANHVVRGAWASVTWNSGWLWTLYLYLPSRLMGKRTALTDVALTRRNMGSNVQLHTRQHITQVDATEPRVSRHITQPLVYTWIYARDQFLRSHQRYCYAHCATWHVPILNLPPGKLFAASSHHSNSHSHDASLSFLKARRNARVLNFHKENLLSLMFWKYLEFLKKLHCIVFTSLGSRDLSWNPNHIS